jgi:hypothetical protein
VSTVGTSTSKLAPFHHGLQDLLLNHEAQILQVDKVSAHSNGACRDLQLSRVRLLLFLRGDEELEDIHGYE